MVGEPDPEVPPPSLRNPRSEPPGALGLPGSQPGLPVPRRSGRPCAPSGNSRLSRVSSAGAKPSGGVSPAPPCSGGRGLPCGCRFTSVQVYTRLGACPPCPRGTAGTGPPSPAPDQQQWRRQGIRRLAGAWPPDLCPLRRWRPQSPRTWWSTTRAPGTPACWPQTASCPSCSASLTAASTAWPSSQVPS